MTFLLDLNVLLALAWPSHLHHAPAHKWFGREGAPSWATCPLTQLGFVRLSSNSAFTSDAVTPTTALAALKSMTVIEAHEFWPDGVDCSTGAFSAGARIIGHRQVSDAYLLSLAQARSGCLATLDKKMHQLLPRGEGASRYLRVIET